MNRHDLIKKIGKKERRNKNKINNLKIECNVQRVKAERERQRHRKKRTFIISQALNVSFDLLAREKGKIEFDFV